MGRFVVSFCLTLSVAACGGTTSNGTGDPSTSGTESTETTAPPTHATLGPFEPKVFLATYASARVAILAPIPSDRAELEERLRAERDPLARRSLARASVAAHVADALDAHAAGDAAGLAAEKRVIDRSMRIATRGNRDERMLAELAFATTYLAYQTDATDTQRQADAFVMRHVVDHELLQIATMIRGELAAASGDATTARAIYRLLVGDARSPLHAYGLYRTASTFCRAAGAASTDATCRDALERTRMNGCAPGAPAEAMEFGQRAANELGRPAVPRRDHDRLAPVYCSRADRETFQDTLLGR